MAHNKDIYKIFLDRGILTAEEIKKYKDSNLTAQELHIIESKILQSEFDSDALEGFQESPEALDRLQLKKSEFFAKNQIKSGFSSKSITILIASLCAFVIVGSILLVKLNKTNPAENIAQNTKPNKQDEVVAPKEIPASVDTVSKEIEEMVLIETSEQLTSNIIKKESIQVLRKEISEEEEIEIEKINIESIESFLDNPKVLHFIQTKKMPTLFFSDLKVIDYSKTYTHPIDVLSFNFTGTPANKEDEHSESFKDGEIKHIEYLTYLEEAMELFSYEDYRGSLAKYRTILKFYENDENAFFYGGLCLYNLNQPKTAISYFQHNQNSDNYIFNQEANWLIAKCYYQIGDKATVKNVLHKIIAQNGFYKEQAEKWLKELK